MAMVLCSPARRLKWFGSIPTAANPVMIPFAPPEIAAAAIPFSHILMFFIFAAVSAGLRCGALAERFDYSGTELGAMECARNYYRWIAEMFSPYLGARVIEAGAGVGTFAGYLLDEPGVAELVAVEAAANLFPALQQRLAGNDRARTIQGYLGSVPLRPADSVVLVNVLEHVRDDVALLPTVKAHLRPGGHLLLFVPALPWLYGSLDRAFEHFRRYRKDQLGERLTSAGFHVKTLDYVNLPGVASWFLATKVLRRKTVGRPSVLFYDRCVVPVVRRIEERWKPPLGQSLIAVASAEPG
jgi:SAM-dependent methyltransferase